MGAMSRTVDAVDQAGDWLAKNDPTFMQTFGTDDYYDLDEAARIHVEGGAGANDWDSVGYDPRTPVDKVLGLNGREVFITEA